MIPDWFRVDCDITGSPKVGRLADALRIDMAAAIGHLVAIYANVRQHRPLDGAIGDVADSTLEQWALWRGKRGRFAVAFRDAFLTDGVLHGWADRQAPLIRRVYAERERAKHNRDKARPSADSTPDGTPTSTRTRSRTVLRQQEQVQEQVQEPSVTRPREAVGLVHTAADDAVRPRLPAEYRPDLDALLVRIPAPDRSAWLRSMAAKLGGMHPPAVSPEALGEALRAFSANGAQVSLKLFDGYVRNASRPPPPRASPNSTARAGRLSAGAQSEANSLRGIALLLGEDTRDDPEDPR